ncbi:hypothetical protein ON010_g4464 [Phytophthora cinnamomi]|nr:hypothetical protein ON010_g4464 [Phytophthora cinnamomi]
MGFASALTHAKRPPPRQSWAGSRSASAHRHSRSRSQPAKPESPNSSAPSAWSPLLLCTPLVVSCRCYQPPAKASRQRQPPRNLHIAFALSEGDDSQREHALPSASQPLKLSSVSLRNAALVTSFVDTLAFLKQITETAPNKSSDMSQNTSSAANHAATGNGKGKARAGANKDGQEVDEKVLRRRLQYKMHQRRHRAKQKQKAASLELEVQSLSAEVDALGAQAPQIASRQQFFRVARHG